MDRTDLKRRYEAGQSIRELATEEHVSYGRIYRNLRAARAVFRKRDTGRAWTGEELQRFRRLYEAGATVHDLATAEGCSPGTMYSLLISVGTQMRPPGPRRGTTRTKGDR